MSQLYQESIDKEEALARLQVVVQEVKKAQFPSISTTESNTIIEESKVISPSKELSQPLW